MTTSSARRARWIVVAGTAFTGAWMAFDGMRALVVGDYVTPQSGAYAGQLGPWSNVLEAVGLDPRSAVVKLAFVVYGVALALLSASFAARRPWAWRWLLITAMLGLWYLPFGTLLSAIAIALLLTTLRPGHSEFE